MTGPSTRTVKAAIVRRGITQAAFAARVGVSPSHLNAILNGRSKLTKLVNRCLLEELAAIERETLEMDLNEQQVVEMPVPASRVVA